MSDHDFEREKACYDQNNNQMRLLSEQMSRIPTIAATLTGALWFGASQTLPLDGMIRFGLFLFAGILNIGLALSAIRVRDVIESYFQKIEEFSPCNFASGRPKNPRLPLFSRYSMITIYVSLMATAAVLSFIAAFGFYWPFPTVPALGGAAVFVTILLIFAGVLIFRRPQL